MPEKDGAAESLAEHAFRRHYDHVYRLLLRRTRSHHEAEELAQRVFADAASALSSRHPPDSLLAWLNAVAERRFVDELRRRRAAAEHLAGHAGDLEVRVEATRYGNRVGDVLRRAIGALPPDQRSVVTMKLFGELSFREIAVKLDTTEAACKMRFSRAIRVVQDALRDEGMEP